MKSLILLTLLVPFIAQGKQYKELTQFIDESTTQVAEALELSGRGDSLELGGKYEFKRFLIRLTAKVGFDVEVAKIELIPELELVFQKEKA